MTEKDEDAASACSISFERSLSLDMLRKLPLKAARYALWTTRLYILMQYHILK